MTSKEISEVEINGEFYGEERNTVREVVQIILLREIAFQLAKLNEAKERDKP